MGPAPRSDHWPPPDDPAPAHGRASRCRCGPVCARRPQAGRGTGRTTGPRARLHRLAGSPGRFVHASDVDRAPSVRASAGARLRLGPCVTSPGRRPIVIRAASHRPPRPGTRGGCRRAREIDARASWRSRTDRPPSSSPWKRRGRRRAAREKLQRPTPPARRRVDGGATRAAAASDRAPGVEDRVLRICATIGSAGTMGRYLPSRTIGEARGRELEAPACSSQGTISPRPARASTCRPRCPARGR